MNKDAKIYIAGHQGLVGSALIKNLINQGYKNIITKTFRELDLRSQQATYSFFKEEKPEYVFLAAAKVGGINANNIYKAEFIYDNLMIAANVINAAYKYNIKKLLNLGSSCIYPKYAPQPLQENYLLTGPLEPTNEPYAIAKIAAIKLCQFYNEQYNTNFISIMPTNLYGPNDNFDLKTAHVLPTLIRKFYLAKLLEEDNFSAIKDDFLHYPIDKNLLTPKTNQEIIQILNNNGINKNSIILWGTGKPFREFLYVDDMANACIHCMKNFSYNELGAFVNIGTGNDIQIKDLANIIKTITKFTGKVLFNSKNFDGTPRKLLDVTKIHTLGWKHKVALLDGITKTYNYYVQSKNKSNHRASN